MPFPPRSGATAWLGTALTAMAFMGIYAFLIVLARTPGIGPMFPAADFFKTALVTHVALAVVIWFLAFVIFLFYYVTDDVPTRRFDLLPAAGALGGILMIVATPFTGPANPTLNNYVPVLDRTLYFFGIGAFFVFATLGAAVRGGTVLRDTRWPLIVRGTLLAAGIALAAGLGLFLSAWNLLPATGDLDNQYYFELLFWGGGHVLQFANALGLMAGWALLSQKLTGRAAMAEGPARLILILTVLFVVAAPVGYLFVDFDSPESRTFFIWLKGLGLAFGTTLLAGTIVLGGKSSGADPVAQRGLRFSIFLFAVGGLFALTLSGSDTRVPAHYHGAIGGVTLCFMTVGLVALTENGWLAVKERTKKFQLTLYGAGQTMFIFGLYVGGLAGLPRKTFGAAQQLDSVLKYTGMSLMGLGGLMAIGSGVMFVLFMLRALLRGRGDARA